MKKTIFTLVMLCFAMMGKAQVTDEQSAILQNGDNAQIFYGADALIEAVAAAPDKGATITLSSGTFNAAEITKSVSIYGAGWTTETTNPTSTGSDNSLKETCIQGITTISAAGGIHMESLKFDGNLAVTSAIDGLDFVKCMWWIKDLSFAEQNDNVTFTRCVIRAVMRKLHNVLFQNCWMYFNNSFTNYSAESNVILNHCHLNSAYNAINNNGARFRCINSTVFTYDYRNPVQVYQFCAMSTSNLNGYVGSSDNWLYTSTSIFTRYDFNNYLDDYNYELTEEAAATYIGNDGTQVGLHGGNFPWNHTPATPFVKDLKLTIDGTQLKVNYNAETR